MMAAAKKTAKTAPAKKSTAKKASAPKPAEDATETIKVFGKEYEVTPEGGHRVKQ